MTTRLQAMRHREVTDAVHDEGGAIALQVLHAGRYGYHPFSVSASAEQVADHAVQALAPCRTSGRRPHGHRLRRARSRWPRRRATTRVEIMGSEGYLINQFLAARTNDRTDRWGGTRREPDALPARDRPPRPRELVGDDLPIIYRISLLDLVEGGQTWDEVVDLAHGLEEAGVTVLNTGIGWHEARVPTIITQVPARRLAWTDRAAEGRGVGPGLRVQPHQHPRARRVAARRRRRPTWSRWRGRCWPTRTSSPRPPPGRADEINTCIACNQACLDHAFANQQASCLVNPRAGRETDAGAAARCRAATATGRGRRRRARPGSPPRCRRPSAASR